MKTKIKRHSRAVLSIVLTLCMLVSCMTVGIIASDAAKVTGKEDAPLGAKDDSDEPVGADYYLYYRTDNTKSLSGMTAVKMTKSGSNYTATFTTSNQNFALAFGTSSSASSSLVTSSWTVNKSGNIEWAHTEDSGGVYFVCGWAPNGTTVNVTYNGSTTVTLGTSSSGGSSCSTNKTYKIVGTANIAGSAWSATATANNMTYNSTLGCYVKSYTNVGGSTSGDMDFRIIEGSTWSKTWGFSRAQKIDQNSIVTTWVQQNGYDNDNNIRMVTSQKANVEIRLDDSKTDTSAITVIVTPAVSTVTPAVTPASSGTAKVNNSTSAVTNITYGSSVSLSATPAANYNFKNWTTNSNYIAFASSTSATTTAVVRGSGTVTANFEKVSFTVSKGTGTGFTITSPAAASTQKKWGESLSVTATADSAYSLEYLYYLNNNTGSEVKIGSDATNDEKTAGSMTRTLSSMPTNNITVYAKVHAKDTYKVTYGVCSGQSSYGYVSVGEYYNSATTMKHTIDNETNVLEATKVNFNARPAVGYKFVGWYNTSAATGGTLLSSNQDETVTVNEAKTYYARFEKSDRYAEAKKTKIFVVKRDAVKNVFYSEFDNPSGTNTNDNFGYTDWPGKTLANDGWVTKTITVSGTSYECWYRELTYLSTSGTNGTTKIIVNNNNAGLESAQQTLVQNKVYLLNWDGTTNKGGTTLTEIPDSSVATTAYYPIKLVVTNPDKGTTYSPLFGKKSTSVTVNHTPSDTSNWKTSRTIANFGSGNVTNGKTTSTSSAATMPSSYSASSTPTFTITYVEKEYFPVTFSSGPNGTVQACTGTSWNASNAITSGTRVKEGTNVTFKATANSGYTFTKWTTSAAPETSLSTDNPKYWEVNATNQGLDRKGWFKKSDDKGTEISGVYLAYNTSLDHMSEWHNSKTLYQKDGRVYAYFDSCTVGTTYWISLSSAADPGAAYGYDNQAAGFYGWNQSDYGATTDFTAYMTAEQQDYDLYWGGNKSGTNYFGKATPKTGTTAFIVYCGEWKNNAFEASKVLNVIPIYDTNETNVDIYAKDGSYRGDSDFDFFPGIADTVLTGASNIKHQSEFDTGSAMRGTTITVTTTISSTYKNTYYVRGFSFNGVTPALLTENDGVANGTGTAYSQEYTIPADFNYDYLEITPIYYFKHEANDANYVQFYIENYDKALEATGWGHTLSVYPYYQDTSGNYLSKKENAFGGYPGQPVIYYGGRRFVEIPTQFTKNSKTGNIKGVTLSNDYWDVVHREYVTAVTEHRQTYDYDDFYKIYKETVDGKEVNEKQGKADQITFAFKYRTAKNNFSDSSQTLTGYAQAKPTDAYAGKTVKAPDSSFAVSAKDTRFPNGWEPLLDYHDRPVDLFGKQLTTAQQNQEPLLVVSDDYAINYVGRYATTWTVYRKNGSDYTKIAEIAPSALIVTDAARLANNAPYPVVTDDNGYPNTTGRTLPDYADEYTALKAYKEMPVLITYESAISNASPYEKNWSITYDDETNKSEVATRNDGRWLYSYYNDDVQANIRIEYKNKESDSEWTVDTFKGSTNEGTVTGGKAYFTNTDLNKADESFANKTETGIVVSDQNKYYKFAAEAAPGYIFAGWWFERDGIVTDVNPDHSQLTGQSQMTSNATFVARYIKNPAAHLSIKHTVAEASEGVGTTYVGVEAMKAGQANVWLTNPTGDHYVANGFSIEDPTYTSYGSGYTFRIWLKTVPDQYSEFNRFTSETGKSADYFSTANQETISGVTTTYFDVPASDLFTISGDYPEQVFDSLTYYSFLDVKTYKYDFNFRYPAYLSKYGEQGYRVTGTFTYDELVKDMTLTGSTLEFKDDATKVAYLNKFAPYEDNFMQTISWDTSVTPTFDDSNSTLSATVQSITDDDKKVNLTFQFNYNTNANYQPVENAKYLGGDDLPVKVVVAKADRPDQKSTFMKNESFVTAPTTLVDNDGNTYIFRYWKVSSERGLGSKYSTAEYTRCYYNEFNFALFQDSVIETVYTLKSATDPTDRYNPNKQQKDDETMGITINFMENSRNQYNDNQSSSTSTPMTGSNDRKKQGDRMYTDFLLNFNSVAKDDGSGNPIQLNTLAANTKKAGLIIEVVGQVDYVDGKYVTKSEAEYKDMYGTDIAEISTKLSGQGGVVNQLDRLKHFINGATESNPIRGAKSEFDVTELDNKNRIQYYYSLANRSHTDLSVGTNRYNVYRAYAYICDQDNSNIQISNVPVYFTIYDMASIQNYAEASVTGGIQ